MRKLKILGLAITVMVTLVVTFYVVENVRGRRTWENFRQEWEAKGEVFDFDHVIPKAPPPEKNFALIPLFQPLFANEPGEPERQRADKLLEMEGDRPSFGKWQLAQPVDLVAWQKFFREQEGWPHPEKAGRPATDVLLALARFEATMTELAQQASQRPLCRFPIKYEDTIAALLPHLNPYRNCVRGFTLRSLAHLANDDTEAALADIRMGLFLAESIRDEPLLISQLVRIACLELVLQPVWEGLKDHRWKPEQLVTIARHLTGIDLLEGYRISILGERDMINLVIRQILNESSKAQSAVEGLSAATASPSQWKITLRLVPSGWWYQSQKRLNEIHLTFTQRIVDTNARRINPAIAEKLRKRIGDLHGPTGASFDILAKLVIPGLEKAVPVIGRTQTSVDHARIACLLELHKTEHGTYPARLADLKSPLPSDPYNGKDYAYNLAPQERFVLYGIGWNQKDDGGRLVLKTNSQNLNLEEGDLEWRYEPVSSPGPQK